MTTKGRLWMAASPAKKTRRRRKGVFVVKRTHLAAEHSGCHELLLLSMILMVGGYPYSTRRRHGVD